MLSGRNWRTESPIVLSEIIIEHPFIASPGQWEGLGLDGDDTDYFLVGNLGGISPKDVSFPNALSNERPLKICAGQTFGQFLQITTDLGIMVSTLFYLYKTESFLT